MRKNILSLSIAAMIGGLGRADSHSVLVPHYTVRSYHDTPLAAIPSEVMRGGAVRVRFRGAANSDDVLDFALFLAPGDVWKGNLHVPPR